MDDMETLLSELSSVIMTKTTKGGISESQILREYQDLCGKRVDFAKHGYRTLGDLLRSNPQKFYCQGKFWFGRVTEENEDIVRSMASEKYKRGKGALRGRLSVQGRPTRFPVSPSQGFVPRAGPQSTERKNPPHFHHSASESTLPRSGTLQNSNDRSRNSGSPLMAGEGAWKSTQRVPAKTGFGNKSFNYVPSGSSTRSSSPSTDDDYDIEPTGLKDSLANSITSRKRSESNLDSFRDIVTNDVAAPDYPPGLPIDGAKDESPASSVYNRPLHPESFRGMVAGNVEAPSFPPGLGFEDAEKQSAATLISTTGDNGQRELSKEQRVRLDIAQKTYDLLNQTGISLSVKEIADRLADRLPEDTGGLIARAQVGMAVKNHSETFSLSSISSNGVVSINPGAPRPSINTVVGAPRDQNTDRTLPRNLQRSQEYDDDINSRPTRRDGKENVVERNENRSCDRNERIESVWKRIEDDSDDDSWGDGVFADTGQFRRNGRFSAPTSTNQPRRQSAEMYTPPRREDRFTHPSSPLPYHLSTYSSFDDREDRDRSDYKRRDDYVRNQIGRAHV